MPSLTVENYLKTILVLGPSKRRDTVSTGRIATAMGVAPSTVTAMLKALEESGLVRYRRYGGVQLTREGESLAVRILRRHRVVELFLVNVLGMPWTEVHEEAEALEHAVSEKVLERMDALLGHPTADPHGDPIPGSNGEMRAGRGAPLSSIDPGGRVEVVRLLDQRPEFLKLVERLGLKPGGQVEVTGKDEAGQVLELRSGDGKPMALGIAAAGQILVEEPSGGRGRAAGRASGGGPRQKRPRGG